MIDLKERWRVFWAWVRGEHHAGPAAHLAIRLGLVVVLLITAARLIGPETYRLSAGTLEVAVRPAVPGGGLTLGLGPFGELVWDIHNSPLDVRAAFVVDRRATSLPASREFEGIAGDFLLSKLPWLLVLAVAVALLVYEGTRRRRAVIAGLTMMGVLAMTIGVGMAALATFNPRALANPSYRGPIGDAPRVLQIIREIGEDFAGVQENLAKVVAGLQRIHADIVTERAAEFPADTVHLLVISDVHNNPLGLLIAEQLVEDFDIEVILNAGDFTDRGTAPEAELFARAARFEIPQVIAPGNHEDRAALERVAQIEGVTVLDAVGARVEVEGVTVLGAPDPNSGSIADDPFNEQAEEQIPIICEQLRAAFQAEPADVVLVHDPRLGECTAAFAQERQIPLAFVWGHTHIEKFEERGTVISMGPGTSGANGIKSATEGRYGFALLELDRETKRPTSVCQFLFDGPQQARQVSCHFLHDEEESG